MLPDGSRLHVVIPQITRQHMAVNIRKFVLGLHSLDDLVSVGTLTEQAAQFLDACLRAGLNVLVSGSTQAGKTTLLNALCATIPARERVVTVEEVFELQVALPRCVQHADPAGQSGGHRRDPVAPPGLFCRFQRILCS
jgi:pilus assembly protein CpaF